jgi:hypothetical protein
MWEMEGNLHKLYRLVGRPEGFASLMMGGGHDVPRYSQSLTLGWLEQWLCA